MLVTQLCVSIAASICAWLLISVESASEYTSGCGKTRKKNNNNNNNKHLLVAEQAITVSQGSDLQDLFWDWNIGPDIKYICN